MDNVLDEDQIRNSRIYKLLEEEMRELIKSEEAELKRLKQVKFYFIFLDEKLKKEGSKLHRHPNSLHQATNLGVKE